MGSIRDSADALVRDRGEFPQFSPEVDLVPVADAVETRVVALEDAVVDAADVTYDNEDSELIADDVQGAIDEVVVRVAALEDAPAGGVNYDVTVVTALGAADVGKVVCPTASPFTTGSTVVVDNGASPPVGVLLSVDGSGGGVVRCFGEAPCLPDLGSVNGLVVSKANGSGKVTDAVTGSGKVVGRMLVNRGDLIPGTMFVTALATVGLRVV